jgi:hypothetical protein
MKNKQLLLLAALTACIAAVAAVVAGRRAAPRAPGTGAGGVSDAGPPLLLPALAENAGRIATVRLQQAGKELVVARGSGEPAWVLPAKGNYAASQERVLAVVRGLTDARIAEKKTAQPELHARLDLADPTQADAKGTLVTLLDASGAQLAAVIVGKKQDAANFDPDKVTTFVREQGKDQSYLVKGSFTLPMDAVEWFSREVLTADASAFAKAVVTRAGEAPTGQTLTITKPDKAAANAVLLELPEGRRLKDDAAATRVLQALAELSADDVAAFGALDFARPGGVTSVFTTYDGVVYTVRSTEHDGGVWVNVQLSLGERPAPAADAPLDAQGEATRAVLKDKVESLHAKLSPWAYKVGAYKAEQVRPTLESLLAPATPAVPGVPGVPDLTQPSPFPPPAGIMPK